MQTKTPVDKLDINIVSHEARWCWLNENLMKMMSRFYKPRITSQRRHKQQAQEKISYKLSLLVSSQARLKRSSLRHGATTERERKASSKYFGYRCTQTELKATMFEDDSLAFTSILVHDIISKQWQVFQARTLSSCSVSIEPAWISRAVHQARHRLLSAEISSPVNLRSIELNLR